MRVIGLLVGWLFGYRSDSGKLEPTELGPQRANLLERLNVALWKAREAARLLGSWETEAAVKFAKWVAQCPSSEICCMPSVL